MSAIEDAEITALLRRTMERKGIEAKDLAAYLGVHPTTISKWLTLNSIPCHHLPEIAEYTGESKLLLCRLRNCPVYETAVAKATRRLAVPTTRAVS